MPRHSTPSDDPAFQIAVASLPLAKNAASKLALLGMMREAIEVATVETIAQASAAGTSQRRLAAMSGLPNATVQRIVEDTRAFNLKAEAAGAHPETSLPSQLH